MNGAWGPPSAIVRGFSSLMVSNLPEWFTDLTQSSTRASQSTFTEFVDDLDTTAAIANATASAAAGPDTLRLLAATATAGPGAMFGKIGKKTTMTGFRAWSFYTALTGLGVFERSKVRML